MKKIVTLFLMMNCTLCVIGQPATQQGYKQVNTFIYCGIVNDTVAHLVWENPSDVRIESVLVERSLDSINFTTIIASDITQLLDLDKEKYDPAIPRFHNVMMSSEHGNIRFLYNDVITGTNLNEIKTWYRVLMHESSGDVVCSPVIKSATRYVPQYSAAGSSNETNQSYNQKNGGDKPGCSPITTPSPGYTPCGAPVTYYGQCCYWTEQPYAMLGGIQIVCGGGSYSWCCNNVPESPGCITPGNCFGYASDPCCVHQCFEYYSCSCTPWQCCSITQLQEQVVTQSVNLPGITLSGVVVNETCTGMSNGSITTTVTNPTPPVNYIWSNSAATQNLVNISGGTYSVTATDLAGCTAASSFVVKSGTVVNVSVTSTDENCGHSNGSATVIASGGSAPLNYTWNTVPPLNITNITNLSAGNYIITVTDGTCTIIDTAVVNNLPGPSVAISNITNETCTAGNGGASVNVTGGNQAYTFQWNSNPPQSTTTLQNVHAGTYDITVTDINNCVSVNSVTITDSPPPVAAIVNITSANCGYSNGAITTSVTGVAPPYTYSWNTNPPQFTQDISNVPAGIYTLTITDSNNCTTIITDTVPPIPGPTASSAATPEICYRADGTATVTASGGIGTYTYLWNSDPPQTTPVATNLVAGTYIVTVSDGGCTTSTSVVVGFVPGPTADFMIKPTVLTYIEGPVSFLDESSGHITNWLWSLGDGTTSDLTQFMHFYSDTGTYIVSLIVIDNNLCTDTIWDTIHVKDIFTIYIPNAFTPNGDGKDDFFFPQGVNWDPDHYEMIIFDRWGNMIYHTTKIGDKWNGTVNNSRTYEESVMDVYVYLINVRELKGIKHRYIGRVALIK